MTTENFDALLNTLLNRRHFQIFTVELHGGKPFEIDHPQATIFRDGIAIFLAPGPVPIWFDHESASQVIDAPASMVP